jgi:SPX domain protein involved in polyphosphate accumulation
VSSNSFFAHCNHPGWLLQTSELSRRIRDAEKQIKQLVTMSASSSDVSQELHTREPTDIETQDHYDHVTDAGSDDDDDDNYDESLASLEDRFHALEEEVATLVADVHDLALYTKLNITGFMKILKVGILSRVVLVQAFIRSLSLIET